MYFENIDDYKYFHIDNHNTIDKQIDNLYKKAKPMHFYDEENECCDYEKEYIIYIGMVKDVKTVK